eukprot:877984-Rhodomonas_salina.1
MRESATPSLSHTSASPPDLEKGVTCGGGGGVVRGRMERRGEQGGKEGEGRWRREEGRRRAWKDDVSVSVSLSLYLCLCLRLCLAVS